MRLSIGCDHGGYDLKVAVMKLLENEFEFVDCGTNDNFTSCDYPDFAIKAAELVKDKSCDYGVVICKSGIGVSIAANKVEGIRPVLNVETGLNRLGFRLKEIQNLSELNGILLTTLKDYLRKNYLNIVNMMGIENAPSVKIKKVKNYLGQYNKRTNTINLNLLLAHIDEELIE